MGLCEMIMKATELTWFRVRCLKKIFSFVLIILIIVLLYENSLDGNKFNLKKLFR